MKFVPGGPMSAPLTSASADVVRATLQRADSISFSLYGLRVTSEPGAKVRAQIAGELRSLMPVKIRAMYSASGWLGTSTRAALVLLLELDARMRLLVHDSNQAFPAFGKWEDLALYDAQAVLLWTCTHEKEGVVYGDAHQLRQLGLEPEVAAPYKSVAERVDPEAQAKIAAGAASAG